IGAVLEEGINQGIEPGLLRRFAKVALHDRERFVRRGEGVHARYTTVTNFALERSLLDSAQKLHGLQNHLVSEEVLERVLSRPKWQSLEDEQRTCVKHVAGPGDLKFIRGIAGAGKTYMMACAREVWEEAGYRVEGIAFTGKAAGELRKGAKIRA